MPATQPTEAEVGRIIGGEKGISGNDEFAHIPDASILKEPPGFGGRAAGVNTPFIPSKYPTHPE